MFKGSIQQQKGNRKCKERKGGACHGCPWILRRGPLYSDLDKKGIPRKKGPGAIKEGKSQQVLLREPAVERN